MKVEFFDEAKHGDDLTLVAHIIGYQYYNDNFRIRDIETTLVFELPEDNESYDIQEQQQEALSAMGSFLKNQAIVLKSFKGFNLRLGGISSNNKESQSES